VSEQEEKKKEGRKRIHGEERREKEVRDHCCRGIPAPSCLRGDSTKTTERKKEKDLSSEKKKRREESIISMGAFPEGFSSKKKRGKGGHCQRGKREEKVASFAALLGIRLDSSSANWDRRLTREEKKRRGKCTSKREREFLGRGKKEKGGAHHRRRHANAVERPPPEEGREISKGGKKGKIREDARSCLTRSTNKKKKKRRGEALAKRGKRREEGKAHM